MDIVLCDDHVLFSGALTAALEARGHHVLGTAARLPEAVELLHRLQPEAVVVDRLFPGEDALDWLARLSSASPASRIVLLSGALDPEALRRAKCAGVTGLVAKDVPIADVLRAIEQAGAGNQVERTGTDRPSKQPTSPLDTLSGREREVLGLLAAGLSTPDAARNLGISYNTARGHVQIILQKLGVRSVLQAVAVAMGTEQLKPER